MMGAERITLHLTALFALAFSCLPVKGQIHGEAAGVLKESYEISRRLPAENRAIFLVRLVDISTSVSPQFTEAWSEELLNLARSLPISPTDKVANWNRVTTEKNALVPLARVNPVKAFGLLSEVDNPVENNNDGFTEDVRADAAAHIFPSYFKSAGVQGVDKMTQRAAIIGDTGEYPYRAMGLIIEALAQTHAEDSIAAGIFNQALRYYARGSVFLDENEQFFELLKRSEFALPPSLYKVGLKAFVDRLSSKNSKEPAQFKGDVFTAGGVVPFTSQSEMLLFRIFGSIARTDIEWARNLMQQFPVLVHADSEISGIAASAALGLPGDATVQEKVDDGLLLRRIQHLQAGDPVTALDDARRLADDSNRCRALSGVMPTLTAANPGLANDTYAALLALQARSIQGTQLRCTVAAAKASFHVGDSRDFSRFTGMAFDFGLNLFVASFATNDNAVTLRHAGAPELIDMSEFAGEHMGSAIVGLIHSSVKDDGLRAYLLLFAAKGLGRREASATVLAGK